MTPRRVLGSGFTGWAIGATLGLLDGIVGRAGALDADWTPLAWGVLIGGGVGLVLGTLVALVSRRGPTRLAPGLLIGALVTALGVGLGFGVTPPPIGAEIRDVTGSAANAVWITIDGLDAADLERMPWTRAWSRGTLHLVDVAAASPDRHETLDAVLSARLPPGRVEGAARIADVLASEGIVPLAVLQGDDAADRDVLGGFAAVRSAVPSGGVRALGTWSARQLDAPHAKPSDTFRAARALLDAVAGRRSFLVVELPSDAPPEQNDDAIRALVTLASERQAERPTVVLLSGLTGEPGDGPTLPTPPSVQTSAWLSAPDVGTIAGREVGLTLGSVDLLPTLVLHATRRWVDTADGVAIDRTFLERALLRRIAGEGIIASGDPVTCSTLHLQTIDPGAVSITPGSRAIRVAGYAYVEPDGGPPLLYDEIADPFWVHDLLALGARTCEGVPAAERAARLAARLDERWKASAEGADRVPVVVPYPFGPPRELYPDPLEGLVER